MSRTALEKIIQPHLVKVLADGQLVLRLDRVWCHEITTANAILDSQARDCDAVFDANKVKAMIDHVSPAKDTQTATQGKIIRDWAHHHGVEFLDVGRSGICHAVIPEKGWILPGEIGIMGDSHTCTHGAFCAFTAGVGTTDLQAGIITGLWVCPPQKVIRINFTGELPINVFAKDLILALINKIGVNGATNAVLEFGGPVIEDLSMDARMTITNMAIEAGATSGMMMVDEKTIQYLWPVLNQHYESEAQALSALSALNSDYDYQYADTITVNVANLTPLITQNYSPADVVNVETLQGKEINQVVIGSCTNGRIEDLRIAAYVFERLAKPVAENVRCIIIPATPTIYTQALEEGLFDIFLGANCCISNPTCGPCLGMSCGVLAPGEVCVSTTNRNFSGRMGKGGMVHLASPATAAMTAVNGFISTPSVDFLSRRPGVSPVRSIDWHLEKATPSEVNASEWEEKKPVPVDYKKLTEQKAKKPKNFSGYVVYLPEKNVDTDKIIPAKYLTIVEKSAFGPHCLEDAGILPSQRTYWRNGCRILVADQNFGCGSSREHAVWALEAAGITAVIAPSFARIFAANMFNNGMLCITCQPKQFSDLINYRPPEIQIDVDRQTVSWYVQGINRIEWEFPLSPYQKQLIQAGGSLDVLLKIAAELAH